MKLLSIVLIIPFLSFAQIKLEKASVFNNKVELLVPSDLTTMSDDMWDLKYHNKVKPELVLSDKDGEINLIASIAREPLEENQLLEYKEFRIKQLKRNIPSTVILSEGLKLVNGKKIGFIKFTSSATDQKVFNYYFFTAVDRKILFFTFNCVEKVQLLWEKTVDDVVNSIKIK